MRRAVAIGGSGGSIRHRGFGGMSPSQLSYAYALLGTLLATAALAQVPSDLRVESRGADNSGRFTVVPFTIRNLSRTRFASVDVTCTILDANARTLRTGWSTVRQVAAASTAYGIVQFDRQPTAALAACRINLAVPQ